MDRFLRRQEATVPLPAAVVPACPENLLFEQVRFERVFEDCLLGSDQMHWLIQG